MRLFDRFEEMVLSGINEFQVKEKSMQNHLKATMLSAVPHSQILKKKLSYAFLILVFTMFCMDGSAKVKTKRISFNNYVEYEGEVENKVPKGRGRLILDGGSLDNFAYGIFEGNQVVDGTIYFAYDHTMTIDKWPHKYRGKYSFSIEEESSTDVTVIYSLIDGSLEIRDRKFLNNQPLIYKFQCKPQDDCVIKCRVGSGGFSKSFKELIALGNYETIESEDYEVSKRIRQIALSSIADGVKINHKIRYERGIWDVDRSEREILFKDNISLENNNGKNQLKLSNGDIFEYDPYNYGNIEMIKKHYSDGMVEFYQKGWLLFTVNGQKLLSNYDNMSVDALFCSIMKADCVKATGMEIFSKDLTNIAAKALRGDGNAQFKLGMAYWNGDEGLNKNHKKAEEWFKEAQNNGYKGSTPLQEMRMVELKKKALNGRKQYDYWIIGHMYEFGEGNDDDKIAINLDSALVWYEKAAGIDPKNEECVTAVKYKMKTGGDYYKHKEQEKEKAAYDTLCKKFGKKYTDDAMAGRITIGMPEALLISAFKTKLIEQNASSKLYRIYGWGMTNFGRTISNNAHTQSVLVRNGKVSNVRNWQ